MSLRIINAPGSWGALEFEGAKSGQIGFAQVFDELAETGYTARGTG